MSHDESEKRLIKARAETPLSPWVKLVQKDVEFVPGEPVHRYHCFALADYISILATTPNDRIPIIRQYRPAVEGFTLELPAGLVDSGEDPRKACMRELREETGLTALSVASLGTYYSDTGRLENRIHVFCVQASDPDPGFVPEPGTSVNYVTMQELRDLIRSGLFQHQLHIAVLLLYELFHGERLSKRISL
jgi:8-oxo-dGTP pyrophosphatase MutT (NUDIX family)